MQDKLTDIWSSLSSVLNGNPTEEEKHQVDHWIAEDKKNRKLFDRLKDAGYTELVENKAQEAKDRVYVKTQMKISRLALQTKLRLWKYMAAASIVLLFISIGFNFFKMDFSDPVWIESKSPAGGLTNLTLSDGTSVALNAGSSLSYPLTFGKEARTVKLNGEAYFEVVENPDSPLIVETNQIKIKVLGTRFNVKCYEDEKRLSTTLLEGSVDVELNNFSVKGKRSIVLEPGQQITLDKITNQVDISRVDADLYVVWKDGQCFFENERFIDIAKILERQFGVVIHIASPELENQIYSGFFSKKEGIQQILNTFRKNRNFDYRWNDTGIEIYER